MASSGHCPRSAEASPLPAPHATESSEPAPIPMDHTANTTCWTSIGPRQKSRDYPWSSTSTEAASGAGLRETRLPRAEHQLPPWAHRSLPRCSARHLRRLALGHRERGKTRWRSQSNHRRWRVSRRKPGHGPHRRLLLSPSRAMGSGSLRGWCSTPSGCPSLRPLPGL